MTRIADVVALAVFALILLGGIYRVSAWWDGRWSGRLPEAPPRWWYWGDPLYRGLRRSFVPALIGIAVAVMAAIALLFLEHRPDDDPLAAVVAVVLGIGLALGVLLFVGVILLNRPKRLVPLRHRSEPGAISEWRSARRRRRLDADV